MSKHRIFDHKQPGDQGEITGSWGGGRIEFLDGPNTHIGSRPAKWISGPHAGQVCSVDAGECDCDLL